MRNVYLWVSALVLASLLYSCKDNSENTIIISKEKFELVVVNPQGDTLCRFPCAVGLNYGDKQRSGDMRTPEGEFEVVSIEDSEDWTHDFNDGYGQREGAYGPWFIRLKVPGHRGIGIHGTCFPSSIGTRATEGCIRLRDSDLSLLIDYIDEGSKVIILPDVPPSQN